MTDLHTHILPGMDDGAADLSQSRAMLRAEQRQGVDTVALTPHFYRVDETVESFLDRRSRAWETLQSGLPANAPNLILGAEVTWYHGIMDEPRITDLCLGDSACILLEMPLRPWSDTLLEQVYQFAGVTGTTPILAHVERYLHLQKKGQLKTLLEMGIPMQISAEAFQGPFAAMKASRLIKSGTWFLGTDCHNTSTRPPNYGPAAAYIKKHTPDPDAILNWHP